MNCSSCRFHDPQGETFFGTCTYFQQRGKEPRAIKDSKVYENGCRFYLDAMVCFECGEKVTFEDSDPASYEKGDDDRCCKPCFKKIVQDTITEVKGMQGIARI